MRRLCLVLLLAASAASAQDSPFDLVRARPDDGPAAAYLRLRDAEVTFRGTDQWDTYAQMRAQAAAPLGLHAEAIWWWDARRGDAPASAPSPEALPDGAHAVGAAEWIAASAGQVVMVNEAHHDAASRLLTLELLPRLYAQGYRYFAAEAFAADSVLAAQPGYPTPAMGPYVGEPVFGAIVREALRLGYTLVPYEIEDEERGGDDPQARRDSMQAVHLAVRTVERDPAARVLVHAGFGHIYEAPDEYWRPMAAYFRERTGIDPLTVDQIEVSEGSVPAFESAAYRGALPLLGDAPSVLLDSADAPLRLGVDAPIDLIVVRPRTVYADGRPTWMALGGAFTPHTVRTPEACTATVCVAEARRTGEPDSTPLDRTVIDGVPEFVIYAPRGEAAVVTFRGGRTGEKIDLTVHFPDED